MGVYIRKRRYMLEITTKESLHSPVRIITYAVLDTKGAILWGTQAYPVRSSSKAICSMMFSLVAPTLSEKPQTWLILSYDMTHFLLCIVIPYGHDIFCPRLLCIVDNLMNGWMNEWMTEYQLLPFEFCLNCLNKFVLHSSVHILLEGCLLMSIDIEQLFYIMGLEYKLFLESWLYLLGSPYSMSLNVTAVFTDPRHSVWPEAAF